MQIVENSNHILTTFNNVGLGVTFKCGNDYFMKIDIVCDLMPTSYKYGVPQFVTYNAIRLKDGKLHEIKEDEEVVLVNCKLVVE